MRRLFAALALLWLCPIARGQEDFATFRARVDGQMRAHQFLHTVQFVVQEHDPFLFYVQRPANAPADFERTLVLGVLPFVRKLLTIFERDYRAPAGLERTAPAGGWTIVVLDSAGTYLNYCTAIGARPAAEQGAHYAADQQLVVGYHDTFGRAGFDAEQRQAWLRELWSALVQAHAAPKAAPQPAWWREGLADYRSSCTNLADSLERPPLHKRHVWSLGFVFLGADGRCYLSRTKDLVRARSFEELLATAKKRHGDGLRSDLMQPIFRAQAEMLVRFLHEGEEGRYQPAVATYLSSVQHGQAGLEAFEAAFASSPEQLQALDRAWLQWLDRTLRPEFPKLPNLVADAAAAAGSVPTPSVAPPIAYDPGALGWTAADFDERMLGVRSLCADGEYELALTLLPLEGPTLPRERGEFVLREAARVRALSALRDAVLAELEQRPVPIQLPRGEGFVRGRFVRRDGDTVVLAVDKTEVGLPLKAFTPAVLQREGARNKRLQGTERWLEVWLRWLQGHKLASLKPLLALEYASMVDLRPDLVADFDPASGKAAAGLGRVQQLPNSDEAAVARQSLDRLRRQVRQHATSPLFASRRLGLDQFVRALAERAFEATDLNSLGITGKVTRLDEDRILVEYQDPVNAPAVDGVLATDIEESAMPMPPGKLAYDGPSGILSGMSFYQWVGSGQHIWSVPLAGRQMVEFDFTLNRDGMWWVMLCAEAGSALAVDPHGRVRVVDQATSIDDTVGDMAPITFGATHHLRIEFDGKGTLEVHRDGNLTAKVDTVGSRRRGELRFFVHSSAPLVLTNLRIAGRPDPVDQRPLRERYVARMLTGLWP